jgi:arabinogalactan oligomer/maltooligosaccharide transport system substrate-binding protein
MYKTVGKLPAYKDSSGIESLQDDAHLRGILEQAPYSDPMPIIPEMAQAWEAQKALFYYSWDKQFSVPDAQKRVMEIYDTALLMQGKSR